MFARTTHAGTRLIVWSPQRDKVAYATAQGLQVCIDDPAGPGEQFVLLSCRAFEELSWSETGEYLAARQTNGDWYVFRFKGHSAAAIYQTDATTLEWVSPHGIVFVPQAGGLILVDLRNTLNEIRLAG